MKILIKECKKIMDIRVLLVSMRYLEVAIHWLEVMVMCWELVSKPVSMRSPFREIL